MDTETRHTAPPGWRRHVALALCLAVGLFYLLAEHRAHLFGVLPYLLLLACPLAHVFMPGCPCLSPFGRCACKSAPGGFVLHGRHGHGHDGDQP